MTRKIITLKCPRPGCYGQIKLHDTGKRFVEALSPTCPECSVLGTMRICAEWFETGTPEVRETFPQTDEGKRLLEEARAEMDRPRGDMSMRVARRLSDHADIEWLAGPNGYLKPGEDE